MYNLAGKEYIKSYEFVEYNLLLMFLNNAKMLRYSVKAERDSVIDQLRSLTVTSIDETTRFPEGLYVNRSYGVAAGLLDRILQAADLTERELDREAETATRKYSVVNDQKVQFFKTISQLIAVLHTAYRADAPLKGIFTRSTFESTFHLEWQEQR